MVEGIVALGILAYCSIGLYRLTIPKPIQKKISIPRSEDQQRPLYPSTLPPSATPAMLGSQSEPNVTQIYNNMISSQFMQKESVDAIDKLLNDLGDCVGKTSGMSSISNVGGWDDIQDRRVKSRNAMRDLKGTNVNKDLDVRRIM